MKLGQDLIDKLIDRAVAGSAGADRRVSELRREHPGAGPQELLDKLGDEYLKRISLVGGGVGAVAAVPAVGTLTAAALTAAQTAEFLRASAKYVMGAASIHGVRVDDEERRRTLLLGSLLGHEGAEAVQGQLGLGTLYWAKGALTRMPTGTVKAVNRMLRRRLARWSATRLGALTLGRLAPFGIGAVVGWKGTRAMGKKVIEGAAEALGPAPRQFTIEVPAVGR